MNCGTYLYLPEEYSLFIQIFILYFVMRREQRFAKMQIFAYDFKIVFYEIQNWQFSQKRIDSEIEFITAKSPYIVTALLVTVIVIKL